MDTTTIAIALYFSINMALTVGVLSDSDADDRPSWAAIVGAVCFGTPLLLLFCIAMASQKISSMLQEI